MKVHGGILRNLILKKMDTTELRYASSSDSINERRTSTMTSNNNSDSDVNNNLLGQSSVPDRNNYPPSTSHPKSSVSTNPKNNNYSDDSHNNTHFPKGKCRERLIEQDCCCVSGSGFSEAPTSCRSSLHNSNSALHNVNISNNNNDNCSISDRSSLLLKSPFNFSSSKSPSTLISHMLILTLITLSCFSGGVDGVCVWQGGRPFRLACGFRQSGLFRIRSLGGLKGYLGAGFTIGDEDGFKDSLTNTDPKPYGYQRVGNNVGGGGGQGGLLGQYSHVTEQTVPNPMNAYPSNPQTAQLAQQQQQLLYLQQIQAEQMMEQQMLEQQAKAHNNKRQRQLDDPTPTPQDIGRGGLTKRASLWQGWPFNKRGNNNSNNKPQDRGGGPGPLRRGPPPPPGHYKRGPPPPKNQMNNPQQGQYGSSQGNNNNIPKRVQFQGYPGGRHIAPGPISPSNNPDFMQQQAQFNQRRGKIPSQNFDIPSAEFDQHFQQFKDQMPHPLLQDQKTDSRQLFMNGGIGQNGVPNQMMLPPPPSPSSRSPNPSSPPHYRQIPDLHRPAGDTSHLHSNPAQFPKPSSTSLPHGLKLLQGTDNFGSVFQLVDRSNVELPEEKSKHAKQFNPNRKHNNRNKQYSPVSVSHDEDGVNINVDLHAAANQDEHQDNHQEINDEEQNGPQLMRQGELEGEPGNDDNVYLSGVGSMDKDALATAVYDPNIFPDIYFTTTTERDGKKKKGGRGNANNNGKYYDNDAREDVPHEEQDIEPGHSETAALHTNEASSSIVGQGDSFIGAQQKKQRRRRKKYRLLKKKGTPDDIGESENTLQGDKPGNAATDDEQQSDDDIVKTLIQNRRRKKGRRRKKLFSTTPESEDIPQEETTQAAGDRDQQNPVSFATRSKEISVEQSKPRVTSLSGGGSREKLNSYLSSGEKKWSGEKKSSYDRSKSSGSGEKTFTGFPPFPKKTTTTTPAPTTKQAFEMSTFGYHEALGKTQKPFNFNDSPSKYNRVGDPTGSSSAGTTGESGGSTGGEYDPRYPPNHEVNRGRIPNKFIRQRDPTTSITTTPTPFLHSSRNRDNINTSLDNSPSGSSRTDFFNQFNRPRPTADSTKFSPSTEFSSSFVKFDSRESIRSIEKTKNFNEQFFSSHFNKSSSRPSHFPGTGMTGSTGSSGPSTFSNPGYYDNLNNHHLTSPGFPQPPEESNLLPWEKAMQDSSSPSSAPTYPKTNSFSNEFNTFAFAPPVMETFGSGPSKSSGGENLGAASEENKSLKKNIFGGDTAEHQGNGGNWEAPNFWGSIQQVDRFGPSSDFVTNDNFKQVLDLENKFSPDSVFPSSPSPHNVDLNDRLSDYFGSTPLPAWNKPSRRKNKSRVTPSPSPTTPTPFIFRSSTTTQQSPTFYPPSPTTARQQSSEERMLNVHHGQEQPGWDAGGVSSFESSNFGLKMPPSPTSFPQDIFHSTTHSDDLEEDSFNGFFSSTTEVPESIKRFRNKHGRRKKTKKPDVSIKIKGEQSAPETTGKSVTIQPAVVLPDTAEVVDILQEDDHSRRNSESEVNGGGDKVNVFHFEDPGESSHGSDQGSHPIMIETNPFAGSQYEVTNNPNGFISGSKEYSDLSQHIHKLTGSSNANSNLQHRQNSDESRHSSFGMNGHHDHEDFESHLPNIVPSPPDPVMDAGGLENLKSIHSLHLPDLTPSVGSFLDHPEDHDEDPHHHSNHYDNEHFPQWGQRDGDKKKEKIIPHPIKIMDIQHSPTPAPTPPPTPPPYDYMKDFAQFQQSMKTPVPILKSPFDNPSPDNQPGIKIVKQYYPPAPQKPPPPSPPPKYKPPQPSYKLPHENWANNPNNANEGLYHEENRNQFHRPPQQSINQQPTYVTNPNAQQRPPPNNGNSQFQTNSFHTNNNNGNHMNNQPQKFSPPKKYYGNDLGGGIKQSKAIPMNNYQKNNNNGGSGINLPHNPFIKNVNQFPTTNSNNNKNPPGSSYYPSPPQQYNVNNKQPLPPKPMPTKIPAQKFHPPPPPKSNGAGGFLSMFSNPFGQNSNNNKAPPKPLNSNNNHHPSNNPQQNSHQQQNFQQSQQQQQHLSPTKPPHPSQINNHMNPYNTRFQPPPPPPPRGQNNNQGPQGSSHPNNNNYHHEDNDGNGQKVTYVDLDDPNRPSLVPQQSAPSLQRPPPPPPPQNRFPPPPPPPQPRNPGPYPQNSYPPNNPQINDPHPHSQYLPPPHNHAGPPPPQSKKDNFSDKDKVLQALETLNNVKYDVIKTVAEEQYGPTILQNLKNSKPNNGPPLPPPPPPTTTTTPRPPLFPFLSSFTTLAPYTSSSASGGGLSSLFNLINPQKPKETNRVSPTGFNNLLSSFGGYGDSSVVSAERLPAPPKTAPSLVSLSTDAITNLFHSLTSGEVPTKPTTTSTTPKPQLVPLGGPSSSEGDIKSLQAQLAKAILAKANRKSSAAQIPQKPNPLGLVNQLATTKNYTQAQIATLKKLIALNNIEQKLNNQLGLEQTTKGSVLKLGSPKSPSIFSSFLNPSGPSPSSPSSLFSNKMLLADRVNQVQNSLFHNTNPNSDPTLLALKALALNKAQSIQQGNNNQKPAGDFQPIPVDLSAILSPSPPLANPKGKRLVDVRNAPKSFYPANATMGFDASSVPLTSEFTCQGQQYFPGLYADTSLGCKVFHLCAKTDAGYLMKSFRCPKETVFDQEVLKCNWNLYVECPGSEQKYHFNKYLSQSFQFLKVLGEFSAGYQPKNSTYSTLPDGM